MCLAQSWKRIAVCRIRTCAPRGNPLIDFKSDALTARPQLLHLNFLYFLKSALVLLSIVKKLDVLVDEVKKCKGDLTTFKKINYNNKLQP